MTQQQDQRRTRKPLLVNLAWATALVLMLGVAYVATYPIVVRMTQTEGYAMPGYRPIEWLIDNTAFREPLCRWADICGAGQEVRAAAVMRKVTPEYLEQLKQTIDY